MKIFLNILWVAGLIVWSFCFAMGFNYGSSDSLLISIILLFAVLGVMSLAIFLLNKWANPDYTANRSSAKLYEIFTLITYVVMVLLTMNGFAHFVAVQTEVKSDVRPQAKNRIQELRSMFGSEDTERSYLSYVSEQVSTYKNYLKKGYADEKTVEVEMAAFQDSLMGMNGEYDRLKDNAKKFLFDCEQSVDLWIPWTVTEYLTQLDANTEKWKNELISLSLDCEWNRTTGESYNPHIESKESLAAKVKDANVSDYTLLSIVIMILLQLVVLFPYLKNKDWSRSGPGKYKGKNGGPRVYEGNSYYSNASNNNIDEV